MSKEEKKKLELQTVICQQLFARLRKDNLPIELLGLPTSYRFQLDNGTIVSVTVTAQEGAK